MAEYDTVILKSSAFSPLKNTPNIINRLKAQSGDIKVLLHVDMGWSAVSGTSGSDAIGGYYGSAISSYKYAKPANVVEYWKGHRCWTENQYVRTVSSGLVYGEIPQKTGMALHDITDKCPVGSDGLIFRKWLAKFLVTGIAIKHDIDGFFFDGMHDYHRSGFAIPGVDLNRDSIEDTSSYKLETWSAANYQFVEELHDELLVRGLTGYQFWVEGNYSNPSGIYGKYFTDFTSGFNFTGVLQTHYGQATGYLTALVDSGYYVAIECFDPPLAGSSTVTGFTTSNVGALKFELAVSYLIDNCMFYFTSGVNSGKQYRESLWITGGLFKRYYNPLTDPIESGQFVYRLYENGLVLINTGFTGAYAGEFNGISISQRTAVFIGADTGIDYYDGTDQLSHGFMGILGTGIGEHLNHPGETIDYEFLNKLELSVDKIKNFALKNHGEFSVDRAPDICMQYFLADGQQNVFDLWKGVDKWTLEGYDWSGSRINPNMARLIRTNPDTRLSYQLQFSSPPPSGQYVFLFYRNCEGSALNTNAFV